LSFSGGGFERAHRLFAPDKSGNIMNGNDTMPRNGTAGNGVNDVFFTSGFFLL
jgi:hypothetical protein